MAIKSFGTGEFIKIAGGDYFTNIKDCGCFSSIVSFHLSNSKKDMVTLFSFVGTIVL